MTEWVLNNISTIIVGAALAAIIICVVRLMIKNKKEGKSSCGCGCGGCAMHDICHSEKKNKL